MLYHLCGAYSGSPQLPPKKKTCAYTECLIMQIFVFIGDGSSKSKHICLSSFTSILLKLFTCPNYSVLVDHLSERKIIVH